VDKRIYVYDQYGEERRLWHCRNFLPHMAENLNECITNHEDVKGYYDPQNSRALVVLPPQNRENLEKALGLKDYIKIQVDSTEVNSVAYGHLDKLKIVSNEEDVSCVSIRMCSVTGDIQEKVFELVIRHPLPAEFVGEVVGILESKYRFKDQNKGGVNDPFSSYLETVEAVSNAEYNMNLERQFVEFDTPMLKIVRKELDGVPRLIRVSGLPDEDGGFVCLGATATFKFPENNYADMEEDFEKLKRNSDNLQVALNFVHGGGATFEIVSSRYDSPLAEGQGKDSRLLAIAAYAVSIGILESL